MTAKVDFVGDSKFSRALASSDYHVRSKGLEALHVWLQRKQEVPEMGLQKLWRGIMFCFWHSDKSHVQEQLADQLVNIMKDLSDDVALSFFQVFLQTMFREWDSIDKLRLDKFMMLVRKFIQGVFRLLLDHGQQIGFGLHLADVYIPELLKVDQMALPSSLPHEQCVSLLQPFIAVLAKSKQPTLMNRIKAAVLEGFAHELQNPQKQGKHVCFARVRQAAVAEEIFSTGATQGVSPKNRAALYDASAAFLRSTKKRRREPDEAATPSGEKPAPEEGMAVTPNPPSSTIAHCDDSNGSPPPQKRKKKGCSARESKGLENSGGKPSGGERQATENVKVANASLSAASSKQGKAGKKRRSKWPTAAEPSGANTESSATLKAPTRAGSKESVMLTPKSAKALAGAVEKVKEIKSKKRISFDLKKNVVWSMNQPLPPPEIRTPPSAKPSGSALKKTSSVGKPKAARRLSW